MKILITGNGGQLGSIMTDKLSEKKFTLISTSRNELDLSDVECVVPFLNKEKPDLIINCAAYTNVKKAETEKDLCMNINYLSVKEMANWVDLNNAKLITISTDYVFDTTEEEITELTKTNPKNVYGESKAFMETLSVIDSVAVIRVPWLFSKKSTNFFSWLYNSLLTNNDVKLSYNKIGCPTLAYDLVDFILNNFLKEFHNGIFNFTSTSCVSRYDCGVVLKKIMGSKSKIESVDEAEFSAGVDTPLKACLSTNKIKNEFNHNSKTLEDVFKQFVDEK